MPHQAAYRLFARYNDRRIEGAKPELYESVETDALVNLTMQRGCNISWLVILARSASAACGEGRGDASRGVALIRIENQIVRSGVSADESGQMANGCSAMINSHANLIVKFRVGCSRNFRQHDVF